MDRKSAIEKNNEKWFDGAAFSDCAEDPEFEAIAKGFLLGDVLERAVLSDEKKAVLILVSLASTQTLYSIGEYTLAAVNEGASLEEIKEALIQATPYIGIEKVRNALFEVNEALSEAGFETTPEPQSTVDEETRFDKGLSVQSDIFGKEHIYSMRENAPAELKHIQDYLSAYCFGDFYTRKTFDVKMREMLTFCAIISLGGCEPQAKAHAAANISVGNTKEELIEIATVCLPFIGFPRTLNAIACINAAVK